MDTVESELGRVLALLGDAVAYQRQDLDPAHEDFGTWGWALAELTARAQDAGRVLGRQVAGYRSRRILRDDEGADPSLRLQDAGEHLQDMIDALDQANRAARGYHRAISHIGVQAGPRTRP